jgi:hypothetical protein
LGKNIQLLFVRSSANEAAFVSLLATSGGTIQVSNRNEFPLEVTQFRRVEARCGGFIG